MNEADMEEIKRSVSQIARKYLGKRYRLVEEMIVLRAMGMKVRVVEERVSETKTVWRLEEDAAGGSLDRTLP